MFKKIIPILPQIIASLFLTGFMVFAWTGPSTAPPGGNVASPLDTSNVAQTKEGGLWLNINGAPVGLIVDKGKVGIGTQTPGEILEILGNLKISSSGQIKNMRAENVSSLPAAGSTGRMLFNTSDNKMYFDNGASWKPIGSSVGLAYISVPGAIPPEAQQVICFLPAFLSGYDCQYAIAQTWLAYQGSIRISGCASMSMSGQPGWIGEWDAAGGGEVTSKRGGASCYYTMLQ